jgi:hypothetical protein
VLNPSYNPDFRQYFQQYIDYKTNDTSKTDEDDDAYQYNEVIKREKEYDWHDSEEADDEDGFSDIMP